MNKIFDFLKNRSSLQKINAIIVALITGLLMLLVYNYEFNVSVKDDKVLSLAIDEYFFNFSVDAKIISKQQINNQLFVFFTRNGYKGHYGFATLERGIFGNYRFLKAELNDYPLYTYEYADDQRLGKEYIIILGMYDLPNVAKYEILSYYDYYHPVYKGEVEKAPFMKIIKTKGEEINFRQEGIAYYDINGNKINVEELKAGMPQPDEDGCIGVGSGELGIIYILLAIIFIIGMFFARHFLLLEDKKIRANK